MKKTVALQSSYIPWKGYFDLMNSADLFIVYDDLQYTKKDWRNRNLVKTRNGLRWLTVPVRKGRGMGRTIREAETDGTSWRRRHWNVLLDSYAGAPYFGRYRRALERLYLESRETSLAKINLSFIREIAGMLGIRTPVEWWPEDPDCPADKTERILSICRRTGTTEYISGPAAKRYIDRERFDRSGVRLTWFDYSGYPEYPQLHPPFEHKVSVLDLLFHTGARAGHYMKSFGG